MRSSLGLSACASGISKLRKKVRNDAQPTSLMGDPVGEALLANHIDAADDGLDTVGRRRRSIECVEVGCADVLCQDRVRRACNGVTKFLRLFGKVNLEFAPSAK